MSLKLGRDPFARLTVRKVHSDARECAWCGSGPLCVEPDRRRRLFALYFDRDTGSSSRTEQGFCSMSCARDYLEP